MTITDPKRKILITGAAGLFGSHLSRRFIKQGFSVIGIDNYTGGYRDFVPEEMPCYGLDVATEAKSIDSVFQIHKPEVVYHTAAFAAVCLSPFMRSHCYTQNLAGYSNVLNSCVNHGVRKIVHFSSMDVYGANQAPFDESMTPMPEDPYGISKLAIELDLKSAREQFGVDYTIVRPHNVFGIYQNIWDRYRNVLGIWIRRALAGEDLIVYGDGSQIRAFSDVQFYMDPLEKLFDSKTGTGETYNIGADSPITILEAAKLVQAGWDKLDLPLRRPNIIHLEARNEVHTAYPCHALAKSHLGFEDNTNLEALIDEMFQWATKQPNREVKTMDYEIEKGMYSYWK